MPSSSNADYEKAQRAANFLRRRVQVFPRVGMVLGSGLGELGASLAARLSLEYRCLPHFPRPSVKGHAGRLQVGSWGKLPVALLEGRVHLYEGYTPAEVAFPVRVLALAGVRTLILTCAAGGIAPRARPGRLMIFSDHLNLQGASPLAGGFDARWGSRFLDMSAAYDLPLRRLARAAANRQKLQIFEGVYAAMPGPNYETPAEIQALKRLGAAAVGMSTVPEVIAARQMNLRVLAIAAITNRAAGLTRRPIGHREVLEAGHGIAQRLKRLLDGVLQNIRAEDAGL